ncbi:MAG: porin [Rhodospirillales bacterium]
MKKILLRTSALVAAGLVTSQAQAVDPIKMSVTGFVSSVFVIGNQSRTPDRFDQMKWDGQIRFNGETRLDNGIKVGLMIELEANTTAVGGTTATQQIDEHFIWFEGQFGRIEVGATDGAGYKLHVFIPTLMPLHGVDTPDYFHFATPNHSNAGLFSTAPSDLKDNEDANKISYFSPSFGPFKFGISYTPEFAPGLAGNSCGASDGGSASQYGVCSANAPGHWKTAIEAGGRFDFDFNGVAIAWSFGGQHAAPSVRNSEFTDLWRFASGLSFTYQGITVGGAVRKTNQGLKGKNDNWMYGLGVTYTTGPWGLSLAWAHTYDQDGNAFVPGKPDKLDLVDGGVDYTLSPGVELFAGAQWAKFSGLSQGKPTSSGVKGYIGSKLTF